MLKIEQVLEISGQIDVYKKEEIRLNAIYLDYKFQNHVNTYIILEEISQIHKLRVGKEAMLKAYHLELMQILGDLAYEELATWYEPISATTKIFMLPRDFKYWEWCYENVEVFNYSTYQQATSSSLFSPLANIKTHRVALRMFEIFKPNYSHIKVGYDFEDDTLFIQDLLGTFLVEQK